MNQRVNVHLLAPPINLDDLASHLLTPITFLLVWNGRGAEKHVTLVLKLLKSCGGGGRGLGGGGGGWEGDLSPLLVSFHGTSSLFMSALVGVFEVLWERVLTSLSEHSFGFSSSEPAIWHYCTESRFFLHWITSSLRENSSGANLMLVWFITT